MNNLIAAVDKPFFEMFLLPLPLRKTKIAPDELLSDEQPRICRKDHVGQFLSWRHQLHITAERLQLLKQSAPLRAREFRIGIPCAIHPRIDLVFDPVVIRRTKKQRTYHSDKL